MSDNNNIRNPTPPTKRDLKILAWMDEGNFLDTTKAFQHFNTIALRDIIYRLRKAGHTIFHKDVVYTTKNGERKSYRCWFTKIPEIVPSGFVTNKQKLASEKTEEKEAKKPILTQATLFY
jgi:hypothetical protein